MVLGSGDSSWLHDGVAGMLSSEDFQRPIKQFIEVNSAVFAEVVHLFPCSRSLSYP